MLSSTRHGGRCIYCAFRAHQLRLQSLRLGRHFFHTSNRSLKERGNPPIRFQSGEGRNSEHSPQRGYLGKADEDGPVRKIFKHIVRQSDTARGGDFVPELQKRLDFVKSDLKDAPLLEQLRKEKDDAGERAESFEKIWKSFTRKVTAEMPQAQPYFGLRSDDVEHKHLLKDLRDAYRTRGVHGLDDRIKYAFYGHLTGSRFTASDIKNQQALADLRYPSEWFPATRMMHRTIHLHVGPTNSGKTYQALQRLEQAGTGVYAGPLRLLAHEVYTRMNAKGKSCCLITGEERRMADKESGTYGDMAACTVEMVPLNRTLDVAVIDEIQMIGNAERGWAWTQALLGVRAKEVHLCGEDRTVPLMREICASLGEKLEIHRYERLSPLKVADESLDGSLRDLRKGDCLVSFSVMGIHALRRQVERATGRKVATVYGSLPPETRAQQARLFNDPNNDYDFLVASDAVGMGLNLAIKRIIFETSSKFDGVQRRTLGVADIKQIAGRAGRYRIATEQAAQDEDDISTQDLSAAKGEESPAEEPENTGLVTTLEKFDFPIVRTAMSSDPEPIRSAGLFPPSPVLERFASYFPPSTPFSYILTRLHELSQMHPRFHLCGLRDQLWIADLIEPVQGLTITDRNIICSSPASKNDADLWRNLMPAYARCIAEQTGGSIVEIPDLPLEILEAEVSASREYLRELERLHKGIVAYLWLSYRFAGIFNTRTLAFHVKSLVEEKIEAVLSKFSFTEASRRRVAALRELQLLKDMEGLDGSEEETENEDLIPAGERASSTNEQSGVIDKEGYGDDGGELQTATQLAEQTSLTSGGDHFGGEEDLKLGDGDPEPQAPVPSAVGSFAQWRVRETRMDDRLSRPLDESEAGVPDAFAAEGGEEARDAIQGDRLEEVGGEGEIEDSETAVEHFASASEERSNPEQDRSKSTPETDLNSNNDKAPRPKAQQAPPQPRAPTEEPQQQAKPAGQNQFGGVPPKHLAHLDVEVTGVEVERELISRP